MQKTSRLSSPSERYPQPKKWGGVLIRRAVRELKACGLLLPIDSHILIALSGGPDSTALAHLLIHYGRRIALRGKIQLLHCNHGWRGAESDADQAEVEQLARAWNVPIISGRVAEDRTARLSPEESARQGRKTFFTQAAERLQKATGQKPLVLTAHHADDQAETVLWHLLTGQSQVMGAGILRFHDRGAYFEARPLLETRKSELLHYLKEEGVSHRFDSSNTWVSLMRNRMRQTLMPEIEAIFPRAVEHLVRRASQAQASGAAPVRLISVPAALALQAGILLRAAHYSAIQKAEHSSSIRGTVNLPQGRQLCWHGHGERRRWELQVAGKLTSAKKRTPAPKNSTK